MRHAEDRLALGRSAASGRLSLAWDSADDVAHDSCAVFAGQNPKGLLNLGLQTEAPEFVQDTLTAARVGRRPHRPRGGHLAGVDVAAGEPREDLERSLTGGDLWGRIQRRRGWRRDGPERKHGEQAPPEHPDHDPPRCRQSVALDARFAVDTAECPVIRAASIDGGEIRPLLISHPEIIAWRAANRRLPSRFLSS